MINYIDPEARYSDATIHNGIIYLGGQVPEDASADASAQTRSVLAQIDACWRVAVRTKRISSKRLSILPTSAITMR